MVWARLNCASVVGTECRSLGQRRGRGVVVVHRLPELIAVGRDVCLISRASAKRWPQASGSHELVDVVEKISDPIVPIVTCSPAWRIARLAEGHLPPKQGFPDSLIDRVCPIQVLAEVGAGSICLVPIPRSIGALTIRIHVCFEATGVAIER